MFEAVLISHLLQYLSGNQMTEAFVKIYQWLKPGGKLFIVTYSPYHKTLQDYIPHYEEKVKMGVRWPGYISDKRAYNTAPKQIKENMPENIHLFNVDVLTRELKACGFIIEKAEMFGGEAAGVPKLFVLNGKQMVGVVAKKPG
jgi:predicted SAM-dependent methyltransferase